MGHPSRGLEASLTYRHTQIGWLMIAIASVVLLLSTLPAGAVQARLIPFAVASSIVLLFGSLTVRVDEQLVRWHFGIGLIRKRLPTRAIRAFMAVRTPWYYGWGIRFTPRGWLYNVSGTAAIELVLEDGKRVLIGTDEPTALEHALRQVVHSVPGTALPLKRPSPRSSVLLAVGIAAVTIAFAGWVFTTGSKPPDVSVSPTGFTVHGGGLYTADVPFSSVQEISLQDTIPRVIRKRNGFNAGNTLRGSFTLDVLGDGRIFINLGVPPYVVVKTADSYVIMNFKNPQQTRTLYEELRRYFPETGR
jgi:hypothetical protein